MPMLCVQSTRENNDGAVQLVPNQPIFFPSVFETARTGRDELSFKFTPAIK